MPDGKEGNLSCKTPRMGNLIEDVHSVCKDGSAQILIARKEQFDPSHIPHFLI